jgi:hypothetical protein
MKKKFEHERNDKEKERVTGDFMDLFTKNIRLIRKCLINLKCLINMYFSTKHNTSMIKKKKKVDWW